MSMIIVYPRRLKKWFLWNMMKSSNPISTPVIKKTILSDQLSSLEEGAIVKIWLVLAHPISPLEGLLGNAEFLFDAYKFAFDYWMALLSPTLGRLNGWVRILWSLTYDSKSAWSYSLSAGLFSCLSLSTIKKCSTFCGVDVFLEHVQRVYHWLNVVSEDDCVAVLFRRMIPQLLGDLTIEFGWNTCRSWDLVHGFVDFVLLKLGCLWVAEVFEGWHDLTVLIWGHSGCI